MHNVSLSITEWYSPWDEWIEWIAWIAWILLSVRSNAVQDVTAQVHIFYPINLYADAADSTDFADNPFLERAFDD